MSQFHQHFARSFFVQKFPMQLFYLHFKLVLFWSKNIGATVALKMLVKLTMCSLLRFSNSRLSWLRLRLSKFLLLLSISLLTFLQWSFTTNCFSKEILQPEIKGVVASTIFSWSFYNFVRILIAIDGYGTLLRLALFKNDVTLFWGGGLEFCDYSRDNWFLKTIIINYS